MFKTAHNSVTLPLPTTPHPIRLPPGLTEMIVNSQDQTITFFGPKRSLLLLPWSWGITNWEHDCLECTYLGSDSYVDYYHHNHKSLVCREGHDGWNYRSAPMECAQLMRDEGYKSLLVTALSYYEERNNA